MILRDAFFDVVRHVPDPFSSLGSVFDWARCGRGGTYNKKWAWRRFSPAFAVQASLEPPAARNRRFPRTAQQLRSPIAHAGAKPGSHDLAPLHQQAAVDAQDLARDVAAPGPARKATAAATSSGLPTRPSGIPCMSASRRSGGRSVAVMSVSM